MPRDVPDISVETLLMAYASGVFPMADSRDDAEVYWVDPKMRGILPLDGFHVARSLARTIRQERFDVTLDDDFEGVVSGCAARDKTWINHTIVGLYRQLHRLRLAHSVEVWEDGALVGGVYGVTMGRAFFGESMFSRTRDASKVALAYAVALLRSRGYALFDTQFLTEHLASLGTVEIPRAAYHARLRRALDGTAHLAGPMPTAQEVLALHRR